MNLLNKVTVISDADGLKLSTLVAESVTAQATVVIVHGMAEHKERYIPFMEFLSKNGYNSIVADLRGHGESIKKERDLGYMYAHGASYAVKDVSTLCDFARQKWGSLPVIILGHSMGTLITRLFLKKHDYKVDGVILTGAPTKRAGIGAARVLTALNTLITGGHHRSKFLNSLAFGSYNKKFGSEGRVFRWLSANEENVQKYEADPLCGYVFTNNGFKALFTLQKKAYTGGWKRKNKGMPIYLFAGEDDPCIGSVRNLQKTAKFLGRKKYSVNIKTYPGLRHEILNENSQEVYDDVLNGLNCILPGGASRGRRYILALDQGTTSSRALVFDKNRNVVAMAQKEFKQYYPQPGYVEHDAEEIYKTQTEVLAQAVRKAGIRASDIAAIGITNQRETTIMWDKNTGKPVYNAIVWQCRRTADFCSELKNRGLAPMIQQKTGLIVDAYFSATKIKWLLDNISGLRERAENGEILFGTVDSWLIWKMTGGKVHITDYTNASRTMLFNINTLKWDTDILRILNIPQQILPTVVPSSGVYGYYELDGVKIPIAGAAGDQQASLFGQGCFEAGEAKNTYGTGCFMLMNTGAKPLLAENGLLSTIGIALDGYIRYAVEGSVFVGGAVIQWLRDELKILGTAAQSEQIATELSDNGGVYFVPAFTGLGAPYWDMYARGAIYGITRGTTRNHIIRAAVESMAFQSDDLIKTFENATSIKLSSLKVDGGACANGFLMQMQSDISDLKIIRPQTLETTALGAALLAGLGVGMWSLDELKTYKQEATTFTPAMSAEQRTKLKGEWQQAVKRTLTQN